MRLTERMKQVWDQCGHEWTEPDDTDVHSLSKSWREIVGPLYDDRIGAEGWKSDWLRAAKLHWLHFIGLGILWEEDFVCLDKSTHVPGPAYAEIAMWIRGDPVDMSGYVRSQEDVKRDLEERTRVLRGWLFKNKDEIWKHADALRVAHDRNYHRRAVKMSMTVADLQEGKAQEEYAR